MLKKHFRPLKSDDCNFVIDAWLKSFTDIERNLRLAGCKNNHKELIIKCIREHKTIICCNPDDEDQIFGFLNYFTYDGVFVTNYVYTKEAFKRFHVATDLFDAAHCDHYKIRISTHNTPSFQMFAVKRDIKHFHLPYLIFKETPCLIKQT